MNINGIRIGDISDGCRRGQPNALHQALQFIRTRSRQLQIKLGNDQYLDLNLTAGDVRRRLRKAGLNDLKLVGEILLVAALRVEREGNSASEVLLNLKAVYEAYSVENRENSDIHQLLDQHLTITQPARRTAAGRSGHIGPVQPFQITRVAVKPTAAKTLEEWVEAAREHEDAGRFKEAAFALNRAIELAGRDQRQELLKRRGDICANTGDHRSAAFCYERLAKESEGIAAGEAWLKAGEQHRLASGPREALFCFGRAFTFFGPDRQVPILQQCVSLHLAGGEPLKAARALSKIIRLLDEQGRRGETKEFYIQAAELYQRVGYTAKAGFCYYRAAELEEDRERQIELYRISGECELKAGEYLKAAFSFNSAARLATGERARDLWLLTAISAQLSPGRQYQSAHCFARAAELARGATATTLWVMAAAEYLKAGAPERAADVYNNAAQGIEGPDAEKYYLLAADLCIGLKRYRQGAFLLLRAAEVNQANAFKLCQQAAGFALMGRGFQTAGRAFEALFKLSQGREAVAYGILAARFMFRAGQEIAALYIFEEITKLYEGTATAREVYFDIAQRYEQLGALQPAAYVWQRLAKLTADPQKKLGFLLRSATLLERADNYKLAAFIYREAAQVGGGQERDLWLIAADRAWRSGVFRSALGFWRHALLLTGNPSLRQEIARMIQRCAQAEVMSGGGER
jgi:hypothetical protein